MKTLQDFNFKNKRVLLRCDFNVPLTEKGEIVDDFRIKRTLPTIKELVKQEARVVLISHSGRPTRDEDRQKYSLKPVALRIEKLSGKKVKFLDDCIGKRIENEISKMRKGEIVLLENLRFYEEEENNNKDFAKNLSRLADIFINDAFAVCHRAHASVEGVPKFLPSGIGLLLENEIEVLSQFLENPRPPLVGIIGGAKVSTKMKFIKPLLKKVNHLLLGGKIANAVLEMKAISLERLLLKEEAIKDLDLTNPRLHLPTDVIVSSDIKGEACIRVAEPGEVRKDEMILDIGPRTAEAFSEIIKQAGMIFWNGPLGRTEEERFAVGSLAIAKAIAQGRGFSIAGGNNTVAFIKENRLQDQFAHISTGGGAMLQFLSEERLLCLEVLK